MKKSKPYVYKRVIAYIIDFIIVTLVSSTLSLVLVNSDKYNDDLQKANEIIKRITEDEGERDDLLKELDEVSYDMARDSVKLTAITLGVSIMYFGVLCYFCNGITLGKYITKIKIVSFKDKKLQIWNYLLRSLFVNLVFINAINIIFIKFLSKEMYLTYYTKLSSFNSIILLASLIIIMFRDDGRGIEDFMGNTKVVNIKDLEEDTIKEAMVVKEGEK